MTTAADSGMTVLNPGMLTLIQDSGRFGHHGIGLSNGGPLDRNAFYWANRLCQNDLGATALEISFGGLEMESQISSVFAVTGASMSLTVNGEVKSLWHSHRVKPGDIIKLGYAKSGCRSYLAIAGGFNIVKSFSSASTVLREKIGGMAGDKVQKNDLLPCANSARETCLSLPENKRPKYRNKVKLRLVLGYQHLSFNDLQLQRFFNSEFFVSDQSDRMGYRLRGPEVKASVDGMLSEGVCHGAVQIPADGQPIVLLNDRQTMGGYPKMGSVISIDTGKLAQLLPGGRVSFVPVTMERSHELLREEKDRFERLIPVTV